jgi:predicted Zn-dependent protease
MKAFWLLLASAAALLASDPASFDARKNNVRALLLREDYQAALAGAEAIHREWADDIAAYELMAAAHLGLGDYSAAEADLQWMLDLRLGKADIAGWRLLARFREETGDLDGALDAINLAYALLAPGQDGEGRALLAQAGRLQFLAGRADLAERALQAALSGGTRDPEALETLARLRLSQVRREEAVGILRELATVSPHPHTLYLLAQATRNPDDYAAFERAARSGDDSRELALYLAGPGKRPAEALTLARRAADRRQDCYTLDALAVALSASGKDAEARTVMARALRSGTRDPEILAHAGRLGVKPE